ncbi:transglutaminase N-terminal domain-containing protein [uncultured Enterovirga sp.]|uniref:transglutaminase family protein n=1 Tax=uncultured Enterovirga sp. TaxID=2026352 RepID=UPI0035CBA518
MIRIRHRTAYRYPERVQLGPHRLMLRPRESRDLRLVSYELLVSPEARVTWAQDVFGNSVATATFSGPAGELVIDSVAELRLDAEAWPIFNIATDALSFPFRYSDEDWTDLGALALPVHADPDGRLRAWAQGFVLGPATDTLSLLRDLSNGVATRVAYEIRDDEGTQSPGETLGRSRGSCRDLAVLFAEAARSLGFGARLVSGYLHNPDLESVGSAGAGSTHAWAEIYVPGAGWITFDPTNRSLGSANLIPVAVARDLRQAMPVIGSYSGGGSGPAEMSVEVVVAEVSGA